MGLYPWTRMMRLKKIIFMTLLLMASPIYSEEPSVFFIQPSNGDTVDSTFEVIFGIKEMSLAPAGTYEDNTGHHHLIIDAPLPNLAMPVPATKHYLHFGKAQDWEVAHR